MDFPPSGCGGRPKPRLSGCWFSLLLSRERLTGSAMGLGWLSAGLGGGEGEDWAVTGLFSVCVGGIVRNLGELLLTQEHKYGIHCAHRCRCDSP